MCPVTCIVSFGNIRVCSEPLTITHLSKHYHTASIYQTNIALKLRCCHGGVFLGAWHFWWPACGHVAFPTKTNLRMRASERDILVCDFVRYFCIANSTDSLFIGCNGCRCYFTYKVGYVICDTTLGPEAAQREMEAGGGRSPQAAMSWREYRKSG